MENNTEAITNRVKFSISQWLDPLQKDDWVIVMIRLEVF